MKKNARFIDIPYDKAPPFQFTFASPATVDIAGFYNWRGTLVDMLPNKAIQTNALYFFTSLTFASDCEMGDYTGAIITRPQFSLHLLSEGGNPVFRQPVPLPQHFYNMTYLRGFTTGARGDNPSLGATISNRFQGSFLGQLKQTGGLVGQPTITLTMILTCQEVTDDAYIRAFRLNYKEVD